MGASRAIDESNKLNIHCPNTSKRPQWQGWTWWKNVRTLVMERQNAGRSGLCVYRLYRSTHDYLEFRINLFGGCTPYVSFAGGRLNNGPPTISIQCSMPSPGPAQHYTTQLVFSASISQWLTRQVWAQRTAIVLFEGGDLGTIDPRPCRSNSAAPGTRGWAIPPTGILTRLIDRRPVN